MTRTLDFKGRTAVITGAGSGIGAALAAALAARGANLALADINEERLNTIADALKSNEIKVTTHTVDVADKDQITAFAEAVEREEAQQPDGAIGLPLRLQLGRERRARRRDRRQRHPPVVAVRTPAAARVTGHARGRRVDDLATAERRGRDRRRVLPAHAVRGAAAAR